jgi:hypothetical protein
MFEDSRKATQRSSSFDVFRLNALSILFSNVEANKEFSVYSSLHSAINSCCLLCTYLSCNFDGPLLSYTPENSQKICKFKFTLSEG